MLVSRASFRRLPFFVYLRFVPVVLVFLHSFPVFCLSPIFIFPLSWFFYNFPYFRLFLLFIPFLHGNLDSLRWLLRVFFFIVFIFFGSFPYMFILLFLASTCAQNLLFCCFFLFLFCLPVSGAVVQESRIRMLNLSGIMDCVPEMKTQTHIFLAVYCFFYF